MISSPSARKVPRHILDEWIRRSDQHPLDIVFELRTRNFPGRLLQYDIDAFLPAITRWKELTLHLAVNPPPSWKLAIDTLPFAIAHALTRLDVTYTAYSGYGVEVQDVPLDALLSNISQAPAIRHLLCHSLCTPDVRTLTTYFPLQDLTTLSFSHTDGASAVDLLRNCTSLEDLTLEIALSNDHPDPPLPAPPVNLPHLRVFNFIFRGGKEFPIFQLLDAPELQALTGDLMPGLTGPHLVKGLTDFVLDRQRHSLRVLLVDKMTETDSLPLLLENARRNCVEVVEIILPSGYGEMERLECKRLPNHAVLAAGWSDDMLLNLVSGAQDERLDIAERARDWWRLISG
ncbi:hypothetical protein AN958_08248 [Leucoagaricus sp. SymC.cos]|nr:hypothetical protein AN958_08248 [Leucoagaricus sp. SymC.cos]